MEGKGIILKSVGELLGYNFVIPSYQRGYRWGKEHVEDLLDDIWEFANSSGKKSGKFYCLQPIIVKKNGDQYLVIDGQQRLTTIYLVLSNLDLFMGKKEKFNIEYETRKDSKDFLKKIKDEKPDNSNIDYYYMNKAFITIKEWLEKYENERRDLTILDMLTTENNGSSIKKDVKFIWYEIDELEDEIEVFTRINSGKIPLTDAELIKALFLNSKNFTDSDEKSTKQIEISKEWDEIEYFLQNDEFWYFLTKNKEYSTRIELIFEVFLGINLSKTGEYQVYREFKSYLENKDNNIDNIIQVWAGGNEGKDKSIENKKYVDKENIKKVFLTLRYWFENRELYHLIGFLIVTGNSLNYIYKKSKGITKTKFKEDIKDMVKEKIVGKDNENLDDTLSNLSYGKNEDKPKIQNILLLFNIATLLNDGSSYLRFAFDKYNKDKWSLEHIHAQNENNNPKNHNARKEWLENVEIYIDNKNISNEIKRVIDFSDIKSDDLIKIQKEIFKLFDESIKEQSEEEKNSISNLALLSGSINSSLNNSIFPVKRKIIIEKDEQGGFIPICTKNVFLKYYSEEVINLYKWTQKDRNNYLKKIKDTLNEFIGENK